MNKGCRKRRHSRHFVQLLPNSDYGRKHKKLRQIRSFYHTATVRCFKRKWNVFDHQALKWRKLSDEVKLFFYLSLFCWIITWYHVVVVFLVLNKHIKLCIVLDRSPQFVNFIYAVLYSRCDVLDNIEFSFSLLFARNVITSETNYSLGNRLSDQ